MRARKRFGRISIANSDAAAEPMLEAAVEHGVPRSQRTGLKPTAGKHRSWDGALLSVRSRLGFSNRNSRLQLPLVTDLAPATLHLNLCNWLVQRRLATDFGTERP
jgi:hypothetical protein